MAALLESGVIAFVVAAAIGLVACVLFSVTSALERRLDEESVEIELAPRVEARAPVLGARPLVLGSAGQRTASHASLFAAPDVNLDAG